MKDKFRPEQIWMQSAISCSKSSTEADLHYIMLLADITVILQIHVPRLGSIVSNGIGCCDYRWEVTSLP